MGMKWGRRKGNKSLGPVKIHSVDPNGIHRFHDSPGIVVKSNVRLNNRHINYINKQRAKGLNTMEALAKMGALGGIERDTSHHITPKESIQAAERYAEMIAKSDHVQRKALIAAGAGMVTFSSMAARNTPEGIASAIGSSVVASVLLYAGSKTVQSMSRKDNLRKIRSAFDDVNVAATKKTKHESNISR